MKTYNTFYTDKEALKAFIETHKIPNTEYVLLQIFSGVCNAEYIENLLFEVKQLLPKIYIIGATTSGEILEESISEEKVVFSFSVFQTTAIKIKSVAFQDSSTLMAQKIITSIEDKEQIKLVLAFSDGLHTNGELFLETFNKYLPNVVVAGGLAGDNAVFEKTYVFTKDGICDGAVAAVLYGKDLIVNTTYNFGWKPIGKEFTITKAEENRVYKIDNYTPSELYGKYLGKSIQKQLPSTGIEFPLIIERYGRKIARAVVGAEDDGSLIFAGNVKNGDKVWLGYGDAENILKNRSDVYNNVIEYPVESIFLYSCMARKALLGESILNEILPLQKIAPTSGFFTYGEFFYSTNNADTQNQLLNETMTVLALSETNAVQELHYEKEYKIESSKIQTIEALSHLVSQTTQELDTLNRELEARVAEEVHKNIIKDQQILHQAKHAQMGEMMSMIAHQWRQPLSAISSTAISLNLKARLNKIDTKTVEELTDKISEYSQHLSHTIDDFREFFKNNKEKKDTTYGELLESVLRIVEASIRNKNIDIIVDLDKTEIILNTYPNELKQVILNLMKNAEEILVEKEIENPKIFIRSEGTVLYVTDNGGGIPKEIEDKIFDPYFSTKTKKDGTGLGLYMSKTIIDEHCNGRLSVKNSQEIGGAEFKIEL